MGISIKSPYQGERTRFGVTIYKRGDAYGLVMDENGEIPFYGALGLPREDLVYVVKYLYEKYRCGMELREVTLTEGRLTIKGNRRTVSILMTKLLTGKL